mgnify:CR=1 FL=1
MANLLLAVPCGLGAGGVDAALNNCVAIHYASRHMSWLRCMWGGASAAGQCAMVVVSGDVVQADPKFAPSRWVYAVAGILGVACVEEAMVPLWNLLTLVGRLDVFSSRAVRWVDAIIACAAVEAALVLFVTLYGDLAHAEYRDPASGAYVDVALGAPGVVLLLAAFVLLMLVMRSLLKNGRAKAIRFSTLDGICEALECQSGDVLEWVEE